MRCDQSAVLPRTLAMSEKKGAEPKEWALEPETEYRFELDPGTSLAIKVSSNISVHYEN